MDKKSKDIIAIIDKILGYLFIIFIVFVVMSAIFVVVGIIASNMYEPECIYEKRYVVEQIVDDDGFLGNGYLLLQQPTLLNDYEEGKFIEINDFFKIHFSYINSSLRNVNIIAKDIERPVYSVTYKIPTSSFKYCFIFDIKYTASVEKEELWLPRNSFEELYSDITGKKICYTVNE